MGEVVQLDTGLIGDGRVVDPDQVLECAKNLLQTVFICGIDYDGQLFMAGSHGAAENVLLMERAKHVFVTSDTGRS